MLPNSRKRFSRPYDPVVAVAAAVSSPAGKPDASAKRFARGGNGRAAAESVKPEKPRVKPVDWLRKRGHTITFIGLFLFSTFVYVRPYELSPSLAFLQTGAYWLAVLTLLIFVPTQLALEGNLTARPREINLVLLLVLTVLLSIPTAISPTEAWEAFSGSFIKVVLMFIVMVNVVRTEWRLKALFLLTLGVSFYLSIDALFKYRAGNLAVQDERIVGGIGGLFGNPNDLALHLATMVPLALGLLFTTRRALAKIIYAVGALLMGSAIVVTFSRGGFLGSAAGLGFFAWKVGRKNRGLVVAAGVLCVLLFLALAPGEYANRLSSIYTRDDSSASARSALFWRALYTTARHPVFGIGMENFHTLAIKEQVSHNAYLQFGAECGVAAMVLYTLFIVTPLKRLRIIERETLADKRTSRNYYLAVALQASIVTYMVSSFFLSVAYLWYIYYLVGYALCLDRLYAAYKEAEKADGGRTPLRSRIQNKQVATESPFPTASHARLTPEI